MKFKKIGLLALTLGVGLSLAACGDEQSKDPVEPNTSVEPQNPAKPSEGGKPAVSEVKTKDVSNVTYNKGNKTLSWDKINGATNYVVNIDGTIFNSKSPNLELSDEFLLPYDGCHIEIKVYAENSNEKGSYSKPILVLIGEDKITDEEFRQALNNLGLSNLTEEELKEFLTKNGITKKELWNVAFNEKETAVSKGIKSKIQAFLYQNMLDEMYTNINPTWQEGQEKKLVKYVEDNFDKVSKALATRDSLSSLMSNQVLKDALGRYADIQSGNMNLQGILDLYSNVQQQLDEAIPSNEDIAQLVSVAKEVCPILLEENSAYAVDIYYAVYPDEAEGLQTKPESLTNEQLTKLTNEVSGILDSSQTILCSVADLTKDVYSSLSKETLETVANVNQAVAGQSKFLKTDEMKQYFKAEYVNSIIEKSILDKLQSNEALDKAFKIVSDSDTVLEKEAVAYLLDTMLPPMLEGSPIEEILGGAKPSDLLQNVFNAKTKEELASVLDTVDSILTPTLDAEFIAASAYDSLYYNLIYEIENDSSLTPEEKQQKIDELEKLADEANIVIITNDYTSIRNMYTSMNDEMLGSIASNLEGNVVSNLIKEIEGNKKTNLDQIDYKNEELNNAQQEFDNYIANNSQRIQEIEALYPTETQELTRMFNEAKDLRINEKYDLVDAKNNEIYAYLDSFLPENPDDPQNSDMLKKYNDLYEYYNYRYEIMVYEINIININKQIEEYNNANAKLDNNIAIINNFVASDHNYDANYTKILKDVQGIMVNLTPEELEECLKSTTTESELTDGVVIKISNLITTSNEGKLIEDIVNNVKVVAENEALAELDLVTTIEENVDPIVATILEVGTYDSTKTLTAEQTEKVNLVKDLFVSLLA